MVTDIEMGGQESATSPPIAIRRLRLDPTGDRRLNRDFILRFNVSSPSLLTASLMLSDDQGSDSQEGAWQLTLISPQGGATGGVKTPRDVAFVLDRSYSMHGWQMVAARSATARMVSY
jgi:Ca-activated chloride channel homolog